MSEKNDTVNPFDPTGFFKSMRDQNMEGWSKMMVQLVNTDAYSQATAKLMDTWLTTSAPFRKMLETVMTQVLTNLNMPTRADVTSIAQRLTNIELRLDDLEARLEEDRTSRKTTGAKSKAPAGENKP